ncbi:MAG: ECF transporter S component [Mycoplasmoidaceae bacterium]
MKKALLNSSSEKKTFLHFLFPLYPINIFKSPILMCILAMLIAIRVVMQFFTIPIPQFGMSLSVAHTALIIIGWLFGPLIGFFGGIVTDTICYFAKPTGPWFWLYAIQEPLLGFMAGAIGSCYLLLKNSDRYKTEVIISKTLLYVFTIASFIIVLVYANPDNPFQGSNGLGQNDFFTIYKYVAIAVIIFFIIIYEITFFYFNKRKKEHQRLFLYISNIVFLNAIIFSFLLGTISIVEYNKIFFPQNSNFIKYGAMFYVIPRVVKESIKTPIQIFLLFSVIMTITPLFKNSLNTITLSWRNKNKEI